MSVLLINIGFALFIEIKDITLIEGIKNNWNLLGLFLYYRLT